MKYSFRIKAQKNNEHKLAYIHFQLQGFSILRNRGLLFLEDENVVALGKSGDINITVFGRMPLRYLVMQLAEGYLCVVHNIPFFKIEEVRLCRVF